MFLAAVWNRSTASERAHLLAMLSLRDHAAGAGQFLGVDGSRPPLRPRPHIMPGQIGTSIRANTRKIHSGDCEADAIGPHGGGGSDGGGPGEPSWLRYSNVTFSPGRISQWADRMAARLAAR
jgi:hypothetical protein